MNKKRDIKIGMNLYHPVYEWGSVAQKGYDKNLEKKVYTVVFQKVPNFINDGALSFHEDDIKEVGEIIFKDLTVNERIDFFRKTLFFEEIKIDINPV